MAKKNKSRTHDKRKQASALKDRRRSKDVRRKANLAKGQKAKAPAGPSQREFPQEEYLFWLAHGSNFLASSYEEGTWTPLLPEIYKGRSYSPEEIAQAAIRRFKLDGEDESAWAGDAKAVVAWTVMERSTVWTYAQEALRRQGKAEGDTDANEAIRQPHNGVVWELFNFLKTKLQDRDLL